MSQFKQDGSLLMNKNGMISCQYRSVQLPVRDVLGPVGLEI